MKIGSSLTLIGIGAILAFAVTANTSVFNIHTAGWVLILIGLVGLLLPARAVGWLGKRMLVRRTYPGGRVERISVPPYTPGPGTRPIQAPLPYRPTLGEEERAADLIEEEVVEEEDPLAGHPTVRPHATTTEVIEDLYEQP